MLFLNYVNGTNEVLGNGTRWTYKSNGRKTYKFLLGDVVHWYVDVKTLKTEPISYTLTIP